MAKAIYRGLKACLCRKRRIDQPDLESKLAEFGTDSGFTRDQLIAGLTTPAI
jgi:hypothetical protein